MSASLMPMPKQAFYGLVNGVMSPIVGGKVYTYEAGTLTPKNTYTTAAGNVANPNPVVLDARGEASVWMGFGAYDIVLKGADDALIWTQENVDGGSSQVGFLQAGTGAVGRTAQDKLREAVSVRDFGASPSNTAAQNNTAFAAAIAHMNSTYTGLDGFLRNSPAKGVLVVPADGVYEVSSQFTLTGNYGFIMQGPVRYTGASSGTVFTIGRSVDFDNLADHAFLLNAFTSVSGVNGFELVNLVDCRIAVGKIRGFSEALVCTARDSRGFFGNVTQIGTFDSNTIDIHVRSINNGYPNGNKFLDGFFYKTNDATVQQHCIKISTDGAYAGIESNTFDGHNFENGYAPTVGKVSCIPVLIESGNLNRVTNIRAENASNVALAKVNSMRNIITTRALFNTTSEIISDNIQQTLAIEQRDMQRVYSSGDLARESVKLSTSGRVWNPNITFNDTWALNSNSTVSTADVSAFDLTAGGIQFLDSRSMVSFKVKTNGDRRFLLRNFAADTSKNLLVAVACFDSGGTRLGDDAGIATGTWRVSQRIKSDSNAPLAYSANLPWTSTGSYVTPIITFQTSIPFELHSSVATIEVYLLRANAASDSDITLSRFDLFSVGGNASPIDACAPTPTTGDRWLYSPGCGFVTFNISRTVTYDPPSLNNGTSTTTTFALSGAAVGDIVTAGFSNDLQGVALTAWVSAASTVSVRLQNETGGTVDLASGTLALLARRLVF